MERAELKAGDEPRVHLVLVFGVGLIGETLTAELLRRGFSGATRLAFSWGQASSTKADELAVIYSWVQGRVKAHVDCGISASRMTLDIVWSAGRGGFASTWETLDVELSSFQDVKALSARLLETLPLATHRFHLTSSAGGLYEGQLNVGPQAVPAPLRPYGELKLEQEQQLLALAGPVVKRIYRPSSVYGFALMATQTPPLMATSNSST